MYSEVGGLQGLLRGQQREPEFQKNTTPAHVVTAILAILHLGAVDHTATIDTTSTRQRTFAYKCNELPGERVAVLKSTFPALVRTARHKVNLLNFQRINVEATLGSYQH